MSRFDEETRISPAGPDAWAGQLSPSWSIGANPNGGYLLALAVAALRAAVPAHPDPLSVTVHYLRPGLGGRPFDVRTRVLRPGRSLTTAAATLSQDGEPRIEVLAAMGALGDAEGEGAMLDVPAPEMPAPEACVARSADAQGVPLPILDRLDIRLHPDDALGGAAGTARVTGWVRFRDLRAPDPLAALLFVDAFPPAVFGLLGVVGWVPTVSLTVQVRRRPKPGWMLGRFVSHDLCDGRVIEDGLLWDETGRLIAQSRQLALVRTPAAGAA